MSTLPLHWQNRHALVSAGMTLRSQFNSVYSTVSANTITLLQVRLDMAHHLILAYELHKDMDVYVRPPMTLTVASCACTGTTICLLHAPAASDTNQCAQ